MSRLHEFVADDERVFYPETLGIPFMNIRCPLCKIHNCSKRADDYIREKKEEAK